MTELKLTGGARIGMVNATMPFATLRVSRNKLALNVSLIGNLVFQPTDIISIEPYVMIPVIGQGIIIKHRVPNYKERVIFWTTKDPDWVIQQIRAAGFQPAKPLEGQAVDREIVDQQEKGGFPFKLGFVIVAVGVWNLLFMVDVVPAFSAGGGEPVLGKGIITASGLVVLTSLLSLFSPGFRRLILKEGRGLEQIRRSMVILLVIGAVMFLLLVRNWNHG